MYISICWKFSTQTSSENIVKEDTFKLTWESRDSPALLVHIKLGKADTCLTLAAARGLDYGGLGTRDFNSLYHSYRSLYEPCVVAVPAAASAVSTELHVVQMWLQESTAAYKGQIKADLWLWHQEASVYVDDITQISLHLPVANQSLPGHNIQPAGERTHLKTC